MSSEGERERERLQCFIELLFNIESTKESNSIEIHTQKI